MTLRFAILAGIALLINSASGAVRSSADYAVTADTLNAGGLRSASADYTDEGSFGEAIETSSVSAGSLTMKQGYIGQLYQAASLVLTATPAAFAEGLTTKMTAIATMDDASMVRLADGDAHWTILDGPLIGITPEGVATAAEVYINAPATVRGTWDGIDGMLTVTVLNVNATPSTEPAPDLAFTSAPFDAGSAGSYQGLLSDADGNVLGAISNFKLLASGAFTAKVTFNGLTYSLAGSLGADGSFDGEIKRPKKESLTVTLQLGTTPGGGLALQGAVNGDGTTGGALIAQTPFTRQNPAPAELVKSFTFLLPATATGNGNLPEGDGYGSAKITNLGVITASGKTGDGVAFTCSGALTADRQWHLFQPLYGGKGQMAGVLTFRDVPAVSDFDGVLRWVKNPNPANKSYPLGFDEGPTLVGSVYAPPAKGERALSELTDQPYNARLTLAGTVIPGGGLAKTVSWLASTSPYSANNIAYYGPEILSASLTGNTGILTGSYYDPDTKLRVAFAGAVMQKQGLASGNFLTNQKSGYVFIEPGTAFFYPGSEGAGTLARLTLPGAPAIPPTLLPVALSSSAAGSFDGILTEGGTAAGGLENVTLSKTGALSGTVIIAGLRYTFHGVVGADGMASVVIARKGLPNVVGSLHLALAAGTVDGFQFTGTFCADGVDYVIDAQRYPAYTAASPAPQAGKYTLAMPAPSAADITMEPGGDGYASLVVANTGTCTGTLVLADGSATTFAGKVSRLGEWSLLRTLYGTSGGYLAGKLTFREEAGVSDVDGLCRWVKPGSIPRTPAYALGFDITRGMIGSAYTPPANGARAFAGLTNDYYNAWMRLSGPDLSSLPALTINSADRAITWNAANKLFYYGPDAASFTFTAATGILTGRYTDTARGINISFGGALLQKQTLLTGRYGADSQSGFFSIVPR